MQVVLGAGLSGLSLAVALVRAGVREPIVVVDRRAAFGRDRTWCTWADPATPFLEHARHRWMSWEVRTRAGTVRGSSAARPYVHLDSEDFYAAALEELDRAPQVELRLGERVLEVGDGWARTDRERLEGRVYDGLALASPALRGRAPVRLWQGFLGWEVRVDRPVFAPGTATLMDFRDSASDHVEFVYVLPFAADRALVEHTTFAAPGPPPAVRRERLAAYLTERVGVDVWEVEHEERGRIPMTGGGWPGRGSATLAIGTAGGGVRPSSGYAFSRIQAHSVAVAAAVRAGRPPPRQIGARRRDVLDGLFLRALHADPAAFAGWSERLVDRLPGDVFARFMSDHATATDELRVIAALPKAPFAAAALGAARDRGRAA